MTHLLSFLRVPQLDTRCPPTQANMQPLHRRSTTQLEWLVFSQSETLVSRIWLPTSMQTKQKSVTTAVLMTSTHLGRLSLKRKKICKPRFQDLFHFFFVCWWKMESKENKNEIYDRNLVRLLTTRSQLLLTSVNVENCGWTLVLALCKCVVLHTVRKTDTPPQGRWGEVLVESSRRIVHYFIGRNKS